ncbi:sodium:calcium antiporter [Pseudaestuariivita sp.]|uniref:sodium:calcium antiporter n=1 Tax=Pseudaestuariivita sp. TaxID=2211669 RepID=UPI004057D938
MTSLATPYILMIFAAAALVIGAAGIVITKDADRLADKTRLGEAMVGAIFLGMATSLSGSVVSVTAALDGRASLAFANGVGGIAAQTAFLSLADIMFRRANLEHASAELSNVLQAAMLTLLLSLTVVAATGPDITIIGVHPVSFLLPVFYVLGLRAGAQLRKEPMWRPVRTDDTREDAPSDDPADDVPARTLFTRFAALALILAGAGWVIAKSAGIIADRSGLSETLVGTLMTAVATSLPELVTTLAAVRRGALQLAVGGIIGGNAFDVLFLSAGDMAYRQGSLYHAVGNADLLWVGVGLAMTSVLLLGLIIRQRQGPAGIGFESALILLLYVGAVALQFA